jgi:methylase of polypeptide subunit release factors
VLGISVLLQNPGFFSEVILTDYYVNALSVAQENYKALIATDKMIK